MNISSNSQQQYFLKGQGGVQIDIIRSEVMPVNIDFGFITSNEPDMYRDNKYGVRRENLMSTQLDKQPILDTFILSKSLDFAR